MQLSSAMTQLLLLVFLPFVGTARLGAPVRGGVPSTVKGQEEQHLKAAAAVTAASDAAAQTQVKMFPGTFPPGVKFAAPGPNWLTDSDETLLFLPIGVSKDLSIQNLKFLSDGKSVLVLSTLTPEVEVSNAEREFKLLLHALKAEAKGDEATLENKLLEWYKTEQDDEVKALVSDTIYGLREMHHNKDGKRAATVPLGVLVQSASKVLSGSALHPIQWTTDSSNSKSKLGGSALNLLSQKIRAARVIKESFLVDMPVPHDPLHVFALQRTPEEYFICYVLNPLNWGKGEGIAHEQLPYKKMKIFDMQGNFLA